MHLAEPIQFTQAVYSEQHSTNFFSASHNYCVLFISGKLACEGKVEHKFDMEPHKENLSDYAKLCRERTKKSMIKTRKVHVSF